MSHLGRDTYQANGLVRSHQHPTVASSQTSLQKLPASSPHFMYQQNNQISLQQQQKHSLLQFPPPPQTVAPIVAPNVPNNTPEAHIMYNPPMVPQQQQSQKPLNSINFSMIPQGQMNGTSSCNNLTQQTILMSPMMSSKNIDHRQHTTSYSNLSQQQTYHQQQQSATNQLIDGHTYQQQQSQQQVPMTTLMIPATAAAQIQSASMQIQQAALQASIGNPNLQQIPQIMVLLIPYMVNQPPTIPPTPDQASVESTLVRHSQSNSSMMRHSQPAGQQQNQVQQSQQQQPKQQPSHPPSTQQQQQQHQVSTSYSRALSSLSTALKPEPEKFYIKANFSYQSSRNRQELSFQKGEILHVLDTLQNNDYGVQYWLATRVNSNGEDAEKGLIPNKNKAEEIALEQRTMDIGEVGGTLDGSSGGVLSASVGRVNFLKRRTAQRSKSLCRDNWDNVVFDIGSFKLPTYERVVYKHPGFCRPVVIFGPLSDIAREKLLKDYPEKYSYPSGLSQSPDHPKVIRLKGVLDVIDQGKHALLDITAPAVEKLNYVSLAPIVIFMKTDSKSIIKEFRSRAAKSLDPNARDEDTLRRDGKSSRKLLEQSLKLEKQWMHVFTATLDLSTMGSEMWYRKLRETIENQQSANVWMGEKKSEKKLAAVAASPSANKSATEQIAFSAQNGATPTNQQQPPQAGCIADSSSTLNERFSESLNISSTKGTNDLQLIPPSDGIYGNRSQLRNAYAHSLAQKLARASSEPKLNGLISDHNLDDDDDDGDDDDEDDDDEIIKKPFSSEYENSSSISSSNGTTSCGKCSSTGGPTTTNKYYHHSYATQQHQIKAPAPPPPPLTQSSAEKSFGVQSGNKPGPSQPTIQHMESIYSSHLLNQTFSNGNNSNQPHSDYHLLPPMAGSSDYHSLQQNSNLMQYLGHPSGSSSQNTATATTAMNGTNNNIIDLSQNHDTRGSAFQVYSDMNQNNYNYYNMNKI